MDDMADAPTGEVVPFNAAGSGELSAVDAARSLADFRYKREAEANREQTAESAEVEKPATAEQESAQADAAQAEEPATGETQEEAPAEPSRELPRSWTKDQTEHWNKLDPAVQDFLIEQDRKASAEVRRVQNEAAEQRKAIEARASEADKVRQQYEAQLPALMQALQDANAGAFGDIKTVEDVTKLAAEDPFRYLQWQAHQSKMAAVKAEMDVAQRRTAEESSKKRTDYATEQYKLLSDMVPELADPKKGSDLLGKAVSNLTDKVGLARDKLAAWAQTDIGHEILSNAHVQKLVIDGLRYQEMLDAKAKIVAKPLPPAQRPGSAKPQSGRQAQIQALEKQLDTASGLDAMRIGAELTKLRRAG
jgi:hypothetical protein